jgi:hypothetical protein
MNKISDKENALNGRDSGISENLTAYPEDCNRQSKNITEVNERWQAAKLIE